MTANTKYDFIWVKIKGKPETFMKAKRHSNNYFYTSQDYADEINALRKEINPFIAIGNVCVNISELEYITVPKEAL